jgi:hypothetical protein
MPAQGNQSSAPSTPPIFFKNKNIIWKKKKIYQIKALKIIFLNILLS